MERDRARDSGWFIKSHTGTRAFTASGRLLGGTMNPDIDNTRMGFGASLLDPTNWVAGGMAGRLVRTAERQAADQLTSGTQRAVASEVRSTYLHVPGARYVDPSPIEAAMFESGVAQGVEHAMVERGTATAFHTGTRREVSYMTDQAITSTSHIHPTYKVAVPSSRDIRAFSEPVLQGNTVHRIVGDRFPHTRHVLQSMGRYPGPLRPIVYEVTTDQVRAALHDPSRITRLFVLRP